MNKVDRLTLLRNAGTGKNDYTVYRGTKPQYIKHGTLMPSWLRDCLSVIGFTLFAWVMLVMLLSL